MDLKVKHQKEYTIKTNKNAKLICVKTDEAGDGWVTWVEKDGNVATIKTLLLGEPVSEAQSIELWDDELAKLAKYVNGRGK